LTDINNFIKYESG